MLYYIFYGLLVLFSVVAHEVAHGAVADAFGDKTARNAGRLTMNPLPHLDIIGSLLIPFLCFASGQSFFVGWAKPVPYNPYNLRNQRWGEPLVAAAGVLMNIAIALSASAALYILGTDTPLPYRDILVTIVTINIGLACFNLLPLPPFDGMRIITSLFPTFGRKILRYVDAHSMIFLLVSLFVAFHLFSFLTPFIGLVIDSLTTF